ncbi:hypothetical protein CT0861_09582 [Colletotrichum tofieldiae]|uniref:Uncharacterized protein n=1 Tax=Colletotrichum tofieldiae TaxID=708197 RepID=A0A166S7G9_9PEZI|nr:hypothetical protein CT0861_09582 [Colletotrichum tofieldiae]
MTSTATEMNVGQSSTSQTAESTPATTNRSTDPTGGINGDGSSNPNSVSIITPTPSSPGEKVSGISTGSLVGTAVGCLIGGLILGGLAAFLLLRRKWKRESGPRRIDEGHVSVTMEPKAYRAADPGLSSNDFPLSQFLLDATPDKEIAAELQSLGELIHLHVENNYHLQKVQQSLSAVTESLLNLGFEQNPGLGSETIASLCLDQKTRQVGLKHVISFVIFNSIDFHSRSRLSMLPAPVAAFLQSLPDNNHDSRQASSLALSKWRTLSAFLLHPNRSQRTPFVPSDSAAAPQSLALATALTTFLHLFIPSDHASQQQQMSHLQAVIFECARFGYTIMSQPSEWQFTYEAGGSRMLVLCPGVDKVAASDGKLYQTPRHVVAPLIMQI